MDITVKNDRLNVRTNHELKAQASEVLSNLGLDFTTAVNAYLVQIVKEGGLPFSVTLKTEREKEMEKFVASLVQSEEDFAQGKGISHTELREIYRKKREGLIN